MAVQLWKLLHYGQASAVKLVHLISQVPEKIARIVCAVAKTGSVARTVLDNDHGSLRRTQKRARAPEYLEFCSLHVDLYEIWPRESRVTEIPIEGDCTDSKKRQ